MPEILARILENAVLLVDGVGYAILLLTVIKFVWRYAEFELERVRGLKTTSHFQAIRVELISHIILAIDFMVISDVIETGLAETRESLLTLGLFVLIRSVLGFVLGLDLREVRMDGTE